MTIQPQQLMYPHNLGLVQFRDSQDMIIGRAAGGVDGGGGVINDFGFNLCRQQKQALQLQQQQEYVLRLMNQQQQPHEKQFLDSVNNNHLVSSVTKNVPAFTSTVKSTNTATTTTTVTLNNNNYNSVDDNINCGIGNNNDVLVSTALSGAISAQLENQRQEMDRYIDFQSQRLKLALQEQSKQHLVTLLRKLEHRANLILRMKDQQIAREKKRAMELEQSIRKVAEESQAWRRIAGENEAMITSLSTSIEHLRERQATGVIDTREEDAESCCGGNEIEVNGGACWGVDGGSNGWKRRRIETVDNDGDKVNNEGDGYHQQYKKWCRVCSSGKVCCVLFLPCRHLCSCKQCESILESCPVCKTTKQATIEVLF